MNDSNLTLYARLTSELMGVSIPEDNLAAVVANLEKIEALAILVMEVEAGDGAEIAPIFRP